MFLVRASIQRRESGLKTVAMLRLIRYSHPSPISHVLQRLYYGTFVWLEHYRRYCKVVVVSVITRQESVLPKLGSRKRIDGRAEKVSGTWFCCAMVAGRGFGILAERSKKGLSVAFN